MCKKSSILLLGFVFLSFTYADSLSDLLDNAKNSYLNNDFSKTLEYFNTAKNELEKITFAANVSEYETVEYSRLRNFPSRYKGKKIKLQHTALSPTGLGKKINGDYYAITVSTIHQRDSFFNDPYEDGALFFIIGKNLLDKLMDDIQAGYVGYFNIYTDKFYEYIKKENHGKDKVQYIAKIVSLERLTYNSYRDTAETIGVIWFE